MWKRKIVKAITADSAMTTMAVEAKKPRIKMFPSTTGY
jgi:hypothetical protein